MQVMIMAFSYGILEGEVLMTSLATSVQNDPVDSE